MFEVEHLANGWVENNEVNVTPMQLATPINIAFTKSLFKLI